MSDQDLTPLLQMKAWLEARQRQQRDELAITTKKLEAIEMALNVMRGADEDLGKFRSVAGKHAKVSTDKEMVRLAVQEYLSKQPRQKLASILRYVTAQNIECSEYGLKKVMQGMPEVVKIGDRDQTRYELVSEVKA